MKRGLIGLGLLLSAHTYAADIVDVYGADNKTAQFIIKKYEKRVAELETMFQSYFRKQLTTGTLTKDEMLKLKTLIDKKTALIEEIKKTNGLKLVRIETIQYPNKADDYSTIDVIQANQSKRFKFITPPMAPSTIVDKKKDLIHDMIEYEQLGLHLLYTKQINGVYIKNCPAHHCIYGFEHAKLKPYASLFNTGVIKEKALILDTLAHDPNVERRGAAVFLVAHFKDPHEVLRILSPYVNDKDESVRNNAIRVIGETIFREKINTIDPMPFITLLDSPVLTDRNKSLLVLLTAAESNMGKRIIIQKGHEQLLALLALKQPNNHELAYMILKTISGQHFGEYDIQAWRKWLLDAQTMPV